MPATLDRSELMERATHHFRKGDFNAALGDYKCLFQQDPRDWNVGNTLGDLYVRLGKPDDAISHFAQLAEQVATDGFAAKARALYKKILRISPENPLARLRIDELERQHTGAASPFLKRVLETARSSRPVKADVEAAAPQPDPQVETVITEAAPPADSASTCEAIAAADPPAADIRFVVTPDSAATPEPASTPDLAPAPEPVASAEVQAISAVADPEWTAVEIAVDVDEGDTNRAPADVAAVCPPPPASETIEEPATPQLQAPEPEQPAEAPGQPAATTPPSSTFEALAEAGQAASRKIEEVAMEDDATLFRRADAAADAAAARRDFDDAADAFERFLAARPCHIPALERLIDVSVDGRLDDRLRHAQEQLAEACLAAGDSGRARQIAIDLIARYPGVARHQQLLDRTNALEQKRSPSAMPAAVPEQRSPGATPRPIADIRHVEPTAPQLDAAERATRAPEKSRVPADEKARPHLAVAAGRDHVAEPHPPLQAVQSDSAPAASFEEIRDELLEDAAAAAEEGVAEAGRLIDAGHLDAAARSLEEAMCAPPLRALAGSRLARILREVRSAEEALLCLEWVAEIPPATEESGHELAYELALTLEALGQQAQALGVYRELLAEVGTAYRDVAARAERLAAA